MNIDADKGGAFEKGLAHVVGPSRSVSVGMVIIITEGLFTATKNPNSQMGALRAALDKAMGSPGPQEDASLSSDDLHLLNTAPAIFRRAAKSMEEADRAILNDRISELRGKGLIPVPGVSQSDLVAWLNASADIAPAFKL